MSQNPSNRKRRGRGGRSGQNRGSRSNSRSISHRSRLGQDNDHEDAATFWARSNARLGMDPDGSNGKSGRNKAPVDFPCAVCGVFVHLDRWPKERQDVRCGSCQGACGSLLTGDDLAISAELAKARKEQHRGKYAGLPEMTEEDLEAVTEMRSLAERMGNGRSSNRKRGSGGRNKRRRGHKGSNSGGGGGGGGGGRRRRRRRGGGGGGGGGGGRG